MNGPRLLLAGCLVVLAAMVLEATLRPSPRPGAPRQAPGRPQAVALPPPAPRPVPAPFIGVERAAPAPAARPIPAASSGEPAATAPSLPPLIGAPTTGPAARAPKAPKPPPTPEQVIARQALALVGADSAAEAVWLDAINDPSRSAHERSDLIEDLNEDGFPDPHHVTGDDLPLIARRLMLIEQLAPTAMDQTNADAFAEAYKDLVNMYAKAAAGE
jgi:hypothetical protein